MILQRAVFDEVKSQQNLDRGAQEKLQWVTNTGSYCRRGQRIKTVARGVGDLLSDRYENRTVQGAKLLVMTTIVDYADMTVAPTDVKGRIGNNLLTWTHSVLRNYIQKTEGECAIMLMGPSPVDIGNMDQLDLDGQVDRSQRCTELLEATENFYWEMLKTLQLDFPCTRMYLYRFSKWMEKGVRVEDMVNGVHFSQEANRILADHILHLYGAVGIEETRNWVEGREESREGDPRKDPRTQRMLTARWREFLSPPKMFEVQKYVERKTQPLTEMGKKVAWPKSELQKRMHEQERNRSESERSEKRVGAKKDREWDEKSRQSEETQSEEEEEGEDDGEDVKVLGWASTTSGSESSTSSSSSSSTSSTSSSSSSSSKASGRTSSTQQLSSEETKEKGEASVNRRRKLKRRNVEKKGRRSEEPENKGEENGRENGKNFQ